MQSWQSSCRWLCVLAGFLFSPLAQAQDAKGLFVEATNLYSACNIYPDLSNNITNVDGFYNNMTTTDGISWTKSGRYTNSLVYDTDFYDPERVTYGNDTYNFDKAGVAISYYSGHGSCDDQSLHPISCTSNSTCTNYSGYLGTCTRVPGATTGKCEYDTPRQATVCSASNDRFGHAAYYSGGNVRFGESADSGNWAGAGTNGGINMAIMDVSCGATPEFMAQQFMPAFAGAHIVASIMPAHVDSDTLDTSDRGGLFAAAFRANPHGSVGMAWLNVVNSASGGSCQVGSTTVPGHGIGGCGAHVIASFEEEQFWTDWALFSESWADLQYNVNDGRDGVAFNWGGICNWDCGTYPAHF
jgi:hypothetical protein